MCDFHKWINFGLSLFIFLYSKVNKKRINKEIRRTNNSADNANKALNQYEMSHNIIHITETDGKLDTKEKNYVFRVGRKFSLRFMCSYFPTTMHGGNNNS